MVWRSIINLALSANRILEVKSDFNSVYDYKNFLSYLRILILIVLWFMELKQVFGIVSHLFNAYAHMVI